MSRSPAEKTAGRELPAQTYRAFHPVPQGIGIFNTRIAQDAQVI